MKRTEFYQLLEPLTEKLYRYAYALIPDDLQAEQLVIDAVNAYLIRERKVILNKSFDPAQKLETQVQRKNLFKGVLKNLTDIGLRRAVQLSEQLRLMVPQEFQAFYQLDPKIRLAIKLRYEGQFSVDDIQDLISMPRYEVIEKIHNGRFLLLNDLNQGVGL